MRQTLSDRTEANAGTRYLYADPSLPPAQQQAVASYDRKPGFIPVGCHAWITVPANEHRPAVNIQTRMWMRNLQKPTSPVLTKRQVRWNSIQRILDRWQKDGASVLFNKSDRGRIMQCLFRPAPERLRPNSVPSVARFNNRLHNLLTNLTKSEAAVIADALNETLNEIVVRRVQDRVMERAGIGHQETVAQS